MNRTRIPRDRKTDEWRHNLRPNRARNARPPSEESLGTVRVAPSGQPKPAFAHACEQALKGADNVSSQEESASSGLHPGDPCDPSHRDPSLMAGFRARDGLDRVWSLVGHDVMARRVMNALSIQSSAFERMLP